jgi:DNA-directed RNA polymerase subunit RPC12/RpoP
VTGQVRCPRCGLTTPVTVQPPRGLELEALVIECRCAGCGRRWRQKLGEERTNALQIPAPKMWRGAM